MDMIHDNDLLLLVCWNINEFLFYKWDLNQTKNLPIESIQ